MASVSYYAYDIAACRWAARKAYEHNPDDPVNIRNLMFSTAVYGQAGQADQLMQRFTNALFTNNETDKNNTLIQFRLGTVSDRLKD